MQSEESFKLEGRSPHVSSFSAVTHEVSRRVWAYCRDCGAESGENLGRFVPLFLAGYESDLEEYLSEVEYELDLGEKKCKIDELNMKMESIQSQVPAAGTCD